MAKIIPNHQETLLDKFDRLLQENPPDFLGTGSCSKWAKQCEAEYNDLADEIRSEIKQLLDTVEDYTVGEGGQYGK